MRPTFTLLLIVIVLIKSSSVVCLRCYLCHSYDERTHTRGSVWNESCNQLTPGKQIETCPKLGTHCFTICSMDRVRKLRYIRRGCTSHKNLCTTQFSKQTINDPGVQVQCNVCSYDYCNHLNSCDPEWMEYEEEHNSDNESFVGNYRLDKDNIKVENPLKTKKTQTKHIFTTIETSSNEDQEKNDSLTEINEDEISDTSNDGLDNTGDNTSNNIKSQSLSNNTSVDTESSHVNPTALETMATERLAAYSDYTNISDYEDNGTFPSDFVIIWETSDGGMLRATPLSMVLLMWLYLF